MINLSTGDLVRQPDAVPHTNKIGGLRRVEFDPKLSFEGVNGFLIISSRWVSYQDHGRMESGRKRPFLGQVEQDLTRLLFFFFIGILILLNSKKTLITFSSLALARLTFFGTSLKLSCQLQNKQLKESPGLSS